MTALTSPKLLLIGYLNGEHSMRPIPSLINVTICSVQVNVGYELCATFYQRSLELSVGARDATEARFSEEMPIH